MKFSILHISDLHRDLTDEGTVYNFDTIDVDGKPEVQFKCLKIMVGERGFEPPTPWSRTRFRLLLKAIEFRRLQVIEVEYIAVASLLYDDRCWSWRLLQLQNRLHRSPAKLVFSRASRAFQKLHSTLTAYTVKRDENGHRLHSDLSASTGFIRLPRLAGK